MRTLAMSTFILLLTLTNKEKFSFKPLTFHNHFTTTVKLRVSTA